MLGWETVSPKPRPETLPCSKITVGDISITVTEGIAGDYTKQWQFFDLSFGEFSDESHDSCCVTCLDMLIAKARAALDELEAKLKEEPCSEH